MASRRKGLRESALRNFFIAAMAPFVRGFAAMGIVLPQGKELVMDWVRAGRGRSTPYWVTGVVEGVEARRRAASHPDGGLGGNLPAQGNPPSGVS